MRSNFNSSSRDQNGRCIRGCGEFQVADSAYYIVSLLEYSFQYVGGDVRCRAVVVAPALRMSKDWAASASEPINPVPPLTKCVAVKDFKGLWECC